MPRGAGANGLAAVSVIGGYVLLASALRNVRPSDFLRQTMSLPSEDRPLSRPFSAVTTPVNYKGGTATSVTVPDSASPRGLESAVRSKLGAPYAWGKVGPDEFDCSGLLVWALRQMGLKVPRFTTYSFGTWAKAAGWTRVSRAQLQAGDVVVKAGHMGVMVSHDRMIHAPHTGTVVQESALWDPQTQWWGWRPPIAQEQFELSVL